MKNSIKKIVLGAILVTSLGACKKGENDPALSLRTRKARLTGEWELTTSTFTNSNTTVDQSGITTTNTSSRNIANGVETYIYNNGNPSTSSVSRKYIFNSDGSFEINYTEDGDTDIYKGSWAFGKKSKELKLGNKETIILFYKEYSSNTSSSTTIFDKGYGDYESLQLDRLSNKELVIIEEGDSNSSYSNVVGGTTFTSLNSGSYKEISTFTKK